MWAAYVAAVVVLLALLSLPLGYPVMIALPIGLVLAVIAVLGRGVLGAPRPAADNADDDATRSRHAPTTPATEHTHFVDAPRGG